MFLFRFYLFYCLLFLQQCKSILPTWVPPSLINYGQHVFTTYGNVNITYQNAFTSQPKKIIYSISQIDFNASTHYINFTNTISGEFTTKVTINFVHFNYTQIYSQTINYITFDSSIAGISTNNVVNLQSQAKTLGTSMNNLTYGTGFRYVNTLNNLTFIKNDDNYISLFVTGFAMYTNLSFWNMSIVYSIPDLVHYIFGGQTSSNISITGITICRLSVDKTVVQKTKLNYVDIGIFTVSPNSVSYFASNYYYYASTAFLIGLKVFDFADSSQIYYSYNFTNLSFNVSSSCNKMVFNYFNYRTRSCPSTQPYYQEISGLCFDVCDSNYFTNITLSACLPCQYTCMSCIGVTNITCLTCDINSHRLFSNNSCVCMTGYYDDGIVTCVKCADNCVTCSNTYSCDLYYSKSLNMTLKFDSSQQFNHFYLFVIFSEHFVNSSEIETITNVTLNSLVHNFTLVNMTNTSITLLFQYFQSYQDVQVIVTFTNQSISDQSNKYLINRTLVIKIRELYYFYPQETSILDKILNVVKSSSTVFIIGYNIVVLTATLYFFLNIIRFAQVLSLYLFLDVQLPIHLKKFMESIYGIINQNIMPFSLPNPFSDTIDFNQPSVYITEGQNFNFLENNLYNIGEILLFTVIYILLNFIFKKIQLKEGLLRTLKNKYFNNLVANILTLVISFQIPMTFVAATTLLDFSNLTYYKLMNIILGVTFLFIGMISFFLLYIYLKKTKKLKQYSTQQNYEFFRRNGKYSEQLVLIKDSLEFTLIVSIVLSKPILALVIILILIVVYIITIYRSRSNFQLFPIYILHLIEIHIHCSFHIIISFFYYGSNHAVSVQTKKVAGYIAIAFIIINFLISIISISISIIYEIHKYHLSKKVKSSQTEIFTQEIVKITKQKLQIQIFRSTKVGDDTKGKQFPILKNIKVQKFSKIMIFEAGDHEIKQ